VEKGYLKREQPLSRIPQNLPQEEEKGKVGSASPGPFWLVTSVLWKCYTFRIMAQRKTTAPSDAPLSRRRMKSPAFILSIFGMGALVAVGAVMLGRSDTGQIDVAAAVREAGVQTDASGNEIAPVNIPGQEFRNIPNGGLVPQGQDGNTPAPEPEPVTTDESATTTAESSEEASTDTDNTEGQTEAEVETSAEAGIE